MIQEAIGRKEKVAREKFAEELYFLLVSSPVRDRLQALATKYGISRGCLRDEIVAFGARVAEGMDLSLQETVYAPIQGPRRTHRQNARSAAAEPTRVYHLDPAELTERALCVG